MAGFSTSLAHNIINYTLRSAAANTIRTRYFALFTADPTDGFSAGAEVSAPWYARVPTGAFSAPSGGVTYNTTRVEFAPVTGTAVTVTHLGVVEGSTPTDNTATLLFSEPLPTPRTLQPNDVYTVDSTGSSGDCTITLV